MDYKNTPEGRAVQYKYADLLPLSRPEPIKPRMTTANRAKIFSPFAALRGYEDGKCLITRRSAIPLSN